MNIVAEISASHDGSLEKALKLVEEASKAGADSVKFQTFEPELICADHNYVIETGPWKGENLLDLYEKAKTPKEWHEPLFDYARNLGLTPFSTPFHESDVDFLETIGCPIYKISSFEIINTDLIKHAAKKGKPLIVSTGMATKGEIERAALSNTDITLLHCVSSYPAKAEESRLAKMNSLKTYAPIVGISDHSPGHEVPVLATAMGAQVIEKHICLDREGLDGGFAMLPGEFKEMVSQVKKTLEIIGKPKFGPNKNELDSYKLRPSLYFSKDLVKGDEIRAEHLITGRPARGSHPMYKKAIIGKALTCDVKALTPCTK